MLGVDDLVSALAGAAVVVVAVGADGAAGVAAAESLCAAFL